jgi:hypothetical protein
VVLGFVWRGGRDCKWRDVMEMMVCKIMM